MSSVSTVKTSPANAIKISAVILNLASDKPDIDSDKPDKYLASIFLAVAYEHCVTIKQTVIRAGRRVNHVNLFFFLFKGPEVFVIP